MLMYESVQFLLLSLPPKLSVLTSESETPPLPTSLYCAWWSIYLRLCSRAQLRPAEKRFIIKFTSKIPLGDLSPFERFAALSTFIFIGFFQKLFCLMISHFWEDLWLRLLLIGLVCQIMRNDWAEMALIYGKLADSWSVFKIPVEKNWQVIH